MNQFVRVLDGPIEFWIAGVRNLASAIQLLGAKDFDRALLIRFLPRSLRILDKFRLAINAVVGELFERQSQLVHPVVAFPALLLAGHLHPIAQRVMRFIRNLCGNSNRQIGYRLAKQPFANPASASDRIVFEVGRVRDEPRRLHQDSQPRFLTGNASRLILRPFGKAIDIMRPLEPAVVPGVPLE